MSALRLPEPSKSMDEADGRPGHVALQSGHLDALMDAPSIPCACAAHPPAAALADGANLEAYFASDTPILLLNSQKSTPQREAECSWPHLWWEGEHP